MEDDNINMVICLFRYEHNPELIVAINENEDLHKFTPDGVNIAYVKSNFISLYHDNYLHLSDEAKKLAKQQKKKTNKGRKPKFVEPKIIRNNNGNNNEFSSAITFGIIAPENKDMVYNAKFFRKNSANISGFRTCNSSYINSIISILFDFINETDCNLQIKYNGDFQIVLCNANYSFTLPKSNCKQQQYAFNLYRLRLLHRENYPESFWECTKLIIDSDSYAYYKFYIKYADNNDSSNKNIYVVKFYPNGRLIICGGKNNAINNLIINKFKQMVNSNFDHLCHLSIPTRKKQDICN